MARRECDQQNELKIRDNISGSDITLNFRMPTTRERQDYQNKALQRKRNKIVENQAEARLEAGLKIITGFKEGDFERKVNGEYQAFTWREGAENYYPDWKAWLGQHAADLVILLAAHVFDVSAFVDRSGEDEAVEGK